MGLQERYRFWQFALFALHYTAALVVIWGTDWGTGWEIPVVVRYNIWTSSNGQCDVGQGCTIREFEQGAKSSLATGGLVSSFSFISGTHHLIIALFTPWYISKVASSKGVAVLRWVDYAWSASLMLMLDSALWLSPPTAQQLILTFSAMFLTVTAGYGSEVAWSLGARGHALAVFLMATAGFTAVWASTFIVYFTSLDPAGDAHPLKYVSADSAAAVPDSEPPDFVVIILTFLFLSYCLFPMAALYRIVALDPSEDGDDVVRMETIYSFLSFFAKIPLLAVYGTAISARAGRITIDGLTNDTSAVGTTEEDEGISPALQALMASVGGSIILGIVMAVHMRMCCRCPSRKGQYVSLNKGGQ